MASCQVLSYPVTAVGVGTFPGDVKHMGLAIWWCTDCMGVLGAEVDDTRDGSWRRCFMVWLYLAAKSSQVGVDVDVWLYVGDLGDRPTACSRQTRGQGLLPDIVLFHHYSGRWHLSGRCEAPGLGYLVEY
jgi:hypothetical protein